MVAVLESKNLATEVLVEERHVAVLVAQELRENLVRRHLREDPPAVGEVEGPTLRGRIPASCGIPLDRT
jgi:hypothetical protein